MAWLLRIMFAFIVAIVAWTFALMVSGSPKVALTIGISVCVFAFLPILRTYLSRHRPRQLDSLQQYLESILASVIVALIVRITHL